MYRYNARMMHLHGIVPKDLQTHTYTCINWKGRTRHLAALHALAVSVVVGGSGGGGGCCHLLLLLLLIV